MKIEVISGEETELRKGRDGNFTTRHQMAAVFTEGLKYPKPFKMPLYDGQQPYAPGVYECIGDFVVGDYEKGVEIRRYVLKAAK